MTSALPSRDTYGIIGAVLAGAICAGLYLPALDAEPGFLQLLAIFAPLSLFIVTLGAGQIAGIIAGFVSIGGTLLASQDMHATLLFSLMTVIPSVFLSALALRYRTDQEGVLYWYPSGRLLLALIAYPCIIFVIVGMTMRDADGSVPFFSLPNATLEQLEADMGKYAQQQLEAATATSPEAASSQNVAAMSASMMEMVRTFNKFIPSLVMVSWVVQMLTYFLVAQIVLRRQNWAMRPTPALTDLELPQWFAAVLAATGAFGLAMTGDIANLSLNLFIVCTIPYLLLGISVVHVWAGKRKSKVMLLVIFYLLMMFGWPMLAVVALGIMEQLLNLRTKLTTTQTA